MRRLDPPTVTRRGGLFAQPQLGFYLVAELNGRVVGSLMVTYEWSDWRNKCFWWIQSVYVEPAIVAAGIFTRLFQAVRAQAESRARRVRLATVCGTAQPRRTVHLQESRHGRDPLRHVRSGV